MALHPVGLDATITAQRNLHPMASVDHFQPTIFRRHPVHSYQDREVLDIFDMGVGIRVDMGVKSTYTG